MDKLKTDGNRPQLQQTINADLESIANECDTPADIEIEWQKLKESTQKAALTALGKKRRRHKDWFDDNDPEIPTILPDLRSKHLEWVNNKDCQAKKERYRQVRSVAQARIRWMKEGQVVA